MCTLHLPGCGKKFSLDVDKGCQKASGCVKTRKDSLVIWTILELCRNLCVCVLIASCFV